MTRLPDGTSGSTDRPPWERQSMKTQDTQQGVELLRATMVEPHPISHQSQPISLRPALFPSHYIKRTNPQFCLEHTSVCAVLAILLQIFHVLYVLCSNIFVYRFVVLHKKTMYPLFEASPSTATVSADNCNCRRFWLVLTLQDRLPCPMLDQCTSEPTGNLFWAVLIPGHNNLN